MPQETADLFFIWGFDDVPYGPVDLGAVVQWIKDERILADTWIFSRRAGTWQHAAEVAELKMFFALDDTFDPNSPHVTAPGSISPGRRAA